MAMKLLPRSEIVKAKSDERKREVEEGRKLAERVDNLRELVATEDASLQKFRNETIRQINDEIEKKAHERDLLTQEVTILAREKEDLRKPLTEKWREVREEDARLIQKGDALSKKERILERRKSEIDIAERQLTIKSSRVTSIENLAYEKLQEAELATKEAEIDLERAKKAKESAYTQKEEMHKELLHRDILVAERERGVMMKEANLNTREAELDANWKSLTDREAILARTVTRLKKSKRI